MVVADKFGTSPDYDLYLIALIAPTLLYAVLNFASFYLFVPYLSRKLSPEAADPAGGDSGFWPVFNLVLLSALIASLAIVALAPYLMKIWASDSDPVRFSQIVFYSRAMAGIVLLGTTEAFMRAYLNVKSIYSWPAAGYIVFNAVSIGTIVLLHDRLGIGALALSWAGGLLVQNLYLLSRLLKFKPFADYTFSLLKNNREGLLSTASILLTIEAVNRSYFMIDRYFAPQFGDGVISALAYCHVLIQIPDAVVGLAIGAVVFPIFSRSTISLDRSHFVEVYRKTVMGALFITIPLAVLYYLNAAELVSLLFERGAFDGRSVQITAAVLRPYAPTIIALLIVTTSVRACYAGGWAKTVLYISPGLLMVKFAATALLPRWFGAPGISAATSVSFAGFALLLFFLTMRRGGTSKTTATVMVIARLLAAGLLAGVATFALTDYLNSYMDGSGLIGLLLRLTVSTGVLLTVYVGLTISLGLKKQMLEVFRGKRVVPDSIA